MSCPDCEGTGKRIATGRSRAYELGRARGHVTGRAEPTDADEDFLHGSMPNGDVEAVDLDDFAAGMLDGRDQAHTRRLGLPAPDPPSDDLLALARVTPTSA